MKCMFLMLSWQVFTWWCIDSGATKKKKEKHLNVDVRRRHDTGCQEANQVENHRTILDILATVENNHHSNLNLTDGPKQLISQQERQLFYRKVQPNSSRHSQIKTKSDIKSFLTNLQ